MDDEVGGSTDYKKLLDEANERMRTWNEPHSPREARRDAETCPAPATHDKLEEAHYFLHGMLFTIHHPDEFRWNLNAFLQACRSILYLAKADLRKLDGFGDWWSSASSELDQNPVVKRVIDSRNFVVHERMLGQSSKTDAGLYRGSKMKLVIFGEPPNDWYSEALLRYVTHVWTGVLLDAGHCEYGMQFGVKRIWRVTELGDGDVVIRCDEAYEVLSRFVKSAHELGGAVMPDDAPEIKGAHLPDGYNLILETGLDPSLAEKWWG